VCFIQVLWRPQRNGGVAEWFKATVLKTVDCNRSMSSNPIASAIFCTDKALIIQGFVVSGIRKICSSLDGSFAPLFGHFRSPSETGANEGAVEALVLQR
jgi:Ni,Fe-hydrogenase I cytochrome b subunit